MLCVNLRLLGLAVQVANVMPKRSFWRCGTNRQDGCTSRNVTTQVTNGRQSIGLTQWKT